MYTYSDYITHQNQYIKGIKLIHQEVQYPALSIHKNFKAELRQTGKSFKAFYNQRGLLIHLINLHNQSPYKCSYFYDKQNRLTKIVEANIKTNQLFRENDIIYKDKNEFVEYIKEYIDEKYERIREIHHSKVYDIICVEQKNVPMDEWYLSQTIKYENLIEELYDTYGDYQSISISELNKNKQVVKSYDLQIDYDEDGEANEPDNKYQPKEYYIHKYFSSGLKKSVSYISNNPWSRTFDYKFNEKGHWIEKVTCIDNSLQFITKRILEYY